MPSLGNVFVYLNFKIHQEEIVKNLCIQREMKKNECNGHCFLSKQLKKEAEKEKKEAENLKEKQELIYLNSIFENPSTLSCSTENLKILFSHHCEKPKSLPVTIFRPPLV